MLRRSHRGRAALAVGALLVGAPATAGAVTLTYVDGSPATVLQAWADGSRVPVAGGSVTVHRERCAFAPRDACIALTGDDIWLAGDAASLRSNLAHELGHRFDYRVMTDEARATFRAIVGDRRPWRTAPDSPHERFAEAYGLCFRHRAIRYQREAGGYGYLPTPAQHRRVCQLVRRAAMTAA